MHQAVPKAMRSRAAIYEQLCFYRFNSYLHSLLLDLALVSSAAALITWHDCCSHLTSIWGEATPAQVKAASLVSLVRLCGRAATNLDTSIRGSLCILAACARQTDTAAYDGSSASVLTPDFTECKGCL